MTDCPRHKHCAYTGTEPGRCPTCHASTAKCAGLHGKAPSDGCWRRGAVARPMNATLREGQPLHPSEAHKARTTPSQPQEHAPTKEYAA